MDDEPALAGRCVVDASAVLALLFGENGAENVSEVVVTGAVICAVNVSEIAELLGRRGLEVERILSSVTAQIAVEPFTLEDARTVAALAPITRRVGLSLADRSCLALARRLCLPVVTADRDWRGIDIGVEVRLIRGD